MIIQSFGESINKVFNGRDTFYIGGKRSNAAHLYIIRKNISSIHYYLSQSNPYRLDKYLRIM